MWCTLARLGRGGAAGGSSRTAQISTRGRYGHIGELSPWYELSEVGRRWRLVIRPSTSTTSPSRSRRCFSCLVYCRRANDNFTIARECVQLRACGRVVWCTYLNSLKQKLLK